MNSSHVEKADEAMYRRNVELTKDRGPDWHVKPDASVMREMNTFHTYQELNAAKIGYYNILKQTIEEGIRVNGVRYFLPTPGEAYSDLEKCRKVMMDLGAGVVIVGSTMISRYHHMKHPFQPGIGGGYGYADWRRQQREAYDSKKSTQFMARMVAGVGGWTLNSGYSNYLGILTKKTLSSCLGWLVNPEGSTSPDFFGLHPDGVRQMYEIGSRGPTFRLQAALAVRNNLIRQAAARVTFNMSDTFLNAAIEQIRDVEETSSAIYEVRKRLLKLGKLSPAEQVDLQYGRLPHEVGTFVDDFWGVMGELGKKAAFSLWMPAHLGVQDLTTYAIGSTLTFLCTSLVDYIWKESNLKSSQVAQYTNKQVAIELTEHEYPGTYDKDEYPFLKEPEPEPESEPLPKEEL